MKRKHKLFVRPKKAYEKSRIKEENLLMGRYGLKNKREIWKTIARISYFRRRAKALVHAPKEEQENFFAKLRNIGLKVETIADVLDLKVENLLERRLPTIIVKKKMAKTGREARQMVSHRRVLINNRTVAIPSYIVSVEEENKISLAQKMHKAPKTEPAKSETAEAKQ